MAKISFKIGENKTFTFNERMEKVYGSFTSFLITNVVKVLVALSACILIFAVVFKDYSFFNNWVFLFAVVSALLTLVKQILNDKLFKSRPSNFVLLLLASSVLLVLSFLLSKSETTLLLPTPILNYQSLLSLLLLTLAFKFNYSFKVLNFVKVVLTVGLSILVLADVFAVVRNLTTNVRVDVSYLSFEMYLLALVVYYLLLRTNLKIYYKAVAYVLGILSLVLLAFSLNSIPKYWVALLTIIFTAVTLAVMNFPKLKNFFLSTLVFFKSKKYVSFALNLVVILLVIGFVGIVIYLIATRLDYRVVTSEFADFYTKLTGKFNPLSLITNSGTTLQTLPSDSAMFNIGLSMGVLFLVSLTAIYKYVFWKVLKGREKNYEVYAFILYFLSLQMILLPVNFVSFILLPFLSLGVLKNMEEKNV